MMHFNLVYLYYKRRIKYTIIIPQMGTITSIKDEGKGPPATSRIPERETATLYSDMNYNVLSQLIKYHTIGMLQLTHYCFNTTSRSISLHTNRLVNKTSVQTIVTTTAKTDPLR